MDSKDINVFMIEWDLGNIVKSVAEMGVLLDIPARQLKDRAASALFKDDMDEYRTIKAEVIVMIIDTLCDVLYIDPSDASHLKANAMSKYWKNTVTKLSELVLDQED